MIQSLELNSNKKQLQIYIIKMIKLDKVDKVENTLSSLFYIIMQYLQ